MFVHAKKYYNNNFNYDAMTKDPIYNVQSKTMNFSRPLLKTCIKCMTTMFAGVYRDILNTVTVVSVCLKYIQSTRTTKK